MPKIDSTGLTLEEKATLLNHNGPEISRFHIRADRWNQCLHGVWWDRPTTMFPVPIAMAATWDTPLVHGIVIRPGQTWCVISSAVEGDSHITVYAPGIANWDMHKVFVTKHWVDAEWIMPPAAVNRAGTEHVITSYVFRHTDRQPLAGYRVRYRLLDGPPALFVQSRTQEEVAVSDLSGNASARLVQPLAGSSAPSPKRSLPLRSTSLVPAVLSEYTA